ncbi:MAG: two-component system, OmpR family, phosphate regulon sensor histidine kinase PhoR [Patescibacteria group bacterium]|nr:two-component system, OmpR family, phosphate regulon sensor histidine kinase PhoR [Patescibacteria group bacterium]
MKHDPLHLSERVKKILNRLTVLLFHGVLTIAIITEVLLDRSFYSASDLMGIIVVVVLFGAFGVIRYLDLYKVNNHPLLYLTIYHVAFGIGFGVFSPAYTPYLFIWLILLYIVNYYYGKQGFVISSSVLFLTLLGASFRLLANTSSPIEYFQFIGVQFASIVIIGLFFLETEAVGDKDRRLLLGSMDKAQLERQRLMSLINSMGDGVISTDERGVIKLYNASALNVLDTNSSLDEKNIDEVMMVIDQSAKVVDLIAEVAEGNSNLISTDHLLVYPDGEKINLYLNISPIKLSFQQNIERGYIISFRDITHEKSLEEERNEFISVVSHELRTPIAITEANISNAQFIAEKGNNLSAVKTSLEAAHKQALFLANMINDLSTLSRAERGKLDMKTEPIDPREIMKSLEEDYTKQAISKGLELFTDIDDSTPVSITSNRLYIREILQNFITNSVKYTKQGSVTILLRGKDNGIEFAVRDTGIGISKSDQKRVFDKFFRSEDFRTRESSGTGLGLYVTKKLMKLINAEVIIKSKLNEGSTFSVFIPDLAPKKISAEE